MPNTPPYRAILTTTGAVALGWAIGFLMAGSPSPEEMQRIGRAMASEETSDSRTRRGMVQAWSDTGTPGTSFESLIDQNGDIVAQFDHLVRGALRIDDNIDRMARLRDIARSIRLIDLPAAVESAKKLPMMDRWIVMQALGARWAEAAPAAAADFAVKRYSNRYGWNELLNGVVEKWASIDNDAAVAWVNTQPEGRRGNLMQSLIQSIARRDPEAALRVLKAQPESHYVSWMHDQVFEHWSKRDPAGAARAAEALSIGGTRDRALQSVASSWAAEDPAAAARWAQSFSDKNQQNQLLRSIANTWSEQDPKAVIQWASSVTEPAVRQALLGTAISQLAGNDLAAATAELRGFPPGQERDNLVTQVVQSTGQSDAKAALTLLELLPAGTSRTSLASQLITQMASSNPKAAAEIFATLPPAQLSYQVGYFAQMLATGSMDFAKEWVEQLADPQVKLQAARGVASALSQGDPRAAAEWLMKADPSADLSGVLQMWVANAPTDVLAWSRELPDGEAKRSSQAALVHSLAQADVEQARKVFAEELSPEAQVSVANHLAHQWANRDVSAARKWAESLPPGGARDNALGGVARSWALQDARAAAQWLERFPAGDERDRVVTQFAGASLQRDPAGAVSWASSIADPDLRNAQLEKLASRWLQMNSSAAREWISNAEELTPSARRRILEQRSPAYYPHSGFYHD